MGLQTLPLLPRATRTRVAGIAVVFACLACLLYPGAARADFVTFIAVGQDGDKEPVSATVQITTGNGTITIKVINNEGGANVDSVGQAISALQFTLGSTPTSVTGAGAVGQMITVDANGHMSTTSGSPDWENNLTKLTANSYEISASGSGKPLDMVLGMPDTSGNYPNANTSITKNQPPQTFQPFVMGSATFTLNAPGVTTNTKVTGTSIGFGTGPDFFLPGVEVAPEPSALALSGIGLAALGLGGFIRRRLRRS
jgi:hypothetical protein